MYILFFEDGEIKKATKLSKDDLLSVAEGVMDVIDISDPSDPKYYDGVEHWRPLESAD